MNDPLSKFAQLAASAAHRLQVRSALNPGLWLCGITTPMCFIASYIFGDDATVRNWLLVGGFLPVAVACVVFVGFAIFKPDKLQSEDYQIRHETLTLILQKGGAAPIDPATIQAIANPVHLALAAPAEDKR
jgi:hypothetical protein